MHNATTDMTQDWDPRSPEVQKNQIKAYDEMRENCPVAWSDYMHWTLFRHEDVMRVLLDHKTFSNAVSSHLSVPNAMDPPEHTPYRVMIERYFSEEKMKAFEPVCRQIAEDLVRDAISRDKTEAMDTLGYPFAARVQCAFLGWPVELAEKLINWVKENQEASFASDRAALSRLAVEFEEIVDHEVDGRRKDAGRTELDNTDELMDETVWGRPVSNEEISSILRNWTVGEIGTISHSMGILLHFLAERQDVQSQLRADISLLPAAIDEILRVHGPLISNRRVATCDVEFHGRTIKAGEKITIMWVSANRDPRAFDNADRFQLDRDASKNLLYGAGVHVCPGAPLARMEMQIMMEALLKLSKSIEFDATKTPIIATYPASGYEELFLILQ